MPPAKLEVGNTLQAARAELSRNSRLIFQITVLFSILSGISTLIRLSDVAGFAISMGITILLGAIYGGMITALICIRRGRQSSMGELWTLVKPALARLIWVTLVAAIGILAGAFAFILPGLILGVFWSVSGQAVLVEKRGVFEALGRSFELVRGSAWPAFGFLAILALLSLLLLLLVFVVVTPLGTGVLGSAVSTTLSNLVSTPILAVGSAVLYNQLSELEPVAREDSRTEDESEDDSGLPPEPRQ